MRKFLFLFAPGLLAACAAFPDVDEVTDDSMANAPYPQLVPLEHILVAEEQTSSTRRMSSQEQLTTSQEQLTGRAAALRARAKRLRSGRLSAEDKKRLSETVDG